MNLREGWAPPTAKDVWKAIRGSGYPFELDVALELQRAYYETTPSWTFLDPSSGKVREIDAIGTLRLGSSMSAAHADLHLLVECKRFRAGVVLFEFESETPQDAVFTQLHWSHVWGAPETVWGRGSSEHAVTTGEALSEFLGWGTRLWAPSKHVCTQFGVLEGKAPNWRFDQQPAFEAVDGLIRGFGVYQQERRRSMRLIPQYVDLGALLLVIEGPIRVFSPRSEGRRASLRKVPWGTLVRRTPIDGLSGIARIDVVRRSHLHSYLDRLGSDFGRVIARLETGRERLLASVEMGRRAATSRARSRLPRER